LKQLRPELDIYFLSDREVKRLPEDTSAACVRRVFYQVEEPIELHLSILDGIGDRYDTPYFDNLQKYAQRPMGTFHALPIARGKSIFKSKLDSRHGSLYGLNLFLAESSATTGGLDSLLEPTGNIKVAQEKAARAFRGGPRLLCHQRHFHLEQDGRTSLAGPCDIMLVDRNCHKSHHYGAVIAGAFPLYVRLIPLRSIPCTGQSRCTRLRKPCST